MPAPISDDQRAQIIAGCQAGHSARSIATNVGVSSSTVSNVAKTIGHRFGQSNAARAREARSSYAAEKRAATAERLHGRVDEIIARMEGEYLVFNFGGRDNTYEQHVLDAPPVEAVRAMMQSVRDAMRTVLDIDRHDNRNDEDIDAVSRWLRDIVGGGG